MKSSVLYFILIMAVLVGCTNDNEPVLDQVINQNEVNINQLKQIATSSGWRVSPKVEIGDRTTPLTEAEIKNFQEDLHSYSGYPRKEEREIEIVLVGNQYTFLLPFTSELITKATGGSTIVYATYGYCFGNTCNQVPIKVFYDLDENGNITYAFGGTSSDYNLWSKEGIECGFCNKLILYSTAYYECSWSNESVALTIWANQQTYWNWTDSISHCTSTSHKHFMITGSVNIKGGYTRFETEDVGEGAWSPIITTGI